MKRTKNMEVKSARRLQDRIARAQGYKDHADAVEQLAKQKEESPLDEGFLSLMNDDKVDEEDEEGDAEREREVDRMEGRGRQL